MFLTLTLALSHRERELPLPVGEGWGEGEIKTPTSFPERSRIRAFSERSRRAKHAIQQSFLTTVSPFFGFFQGETVRQISCRG